MSEKNWCCYCLESPEGNTYVGSTVDIDRRLRQHNGEISGGAKYTSRFSHWRRICHVLGFPDSRSALQFEWKWKQLSRKATGSTPTERRMSALVELVNLEKSTTTSRNFSEYEGPLLIFIESDTFCIDFLEKHPMRYAFVQKV